MNVVIIKNRMQKSIIYFIRTPDCMRSSVSETHHVSYCIVILNCDPTLEKGAYGANYDTEICEQKDGKL